MCRVVSSCINDERGDRKMGSRLRVVLAAAVCAVTGLTYSSASAQSDPRERLAAAVETVEGACASDLKSFCGNVTRGEGRLVLCMQAFDDQLSKRCQFA